MFHKAMLKRLLLLGMTCCVAMVACEFLTRKYAPQDLSGTWRIYTTRGYYVNRANAMVRHQFGDRVVNYRLNSLHLRGPEFDASIPSVLVLGDSFTFGILLNENNTLPNSFQRMFHETFKEKNFQFLNGGAAGWGTADYLAYLEDFGEKISPKVVIVIFNGDDIDRSVRLGLYTLKNKSGLELDEHSISAKLSSFKNFLNSSIVYQFFLEHSHFFTFFRTQLIMKAGPGINIQNSVSVKSENKMLISENLDSVQLGHALFHRMNEWCKKHDARLWVVTTGWYAEFQDSYQTLAFLKEANNIFATEKIPFHDSMSEIKEIYGNHLREHAILNDGHPDEVGTSIIATHAWKWLKKEFQSAPN
jgi:lysophospholipase L1-like esterase